MKLKLRFTLILGLCVFVLIAFVLYLRLNQPERQPKDPESARVHLKLVHTTTAPKPQAKDDNFYKNLTITSVATVAGIKINRKLQMLNFSLAEQTSKYSDILTVLKNNVRHDVPIKVSPWDLAAGWVRPDEIYSDDRPELGYVLNSMATYAVTYAGVGYKGTQLKIMLKLNGGQDVIFKPIRYERDYIITGSPYDGADRHNGEIAAFHLNRLLGLSRCPLAVGRVVNLKTEVQPVASNSLSKTFFMKDNNTCFYGNCYYCSPADPACGKGDTIEGAAILMLPAKYRLKKYRSPWQRTYKEGITARWEQDYKYCEQVRKIRLYSSGRRLLDLIDAAVFDYLIGNADRHHYEVFADFPDSAVILLDNGKSFGNPYWDELTILAPLYQCCRIRRKLYDRLWKLVGHLGQSLKDLMGFDRLAPVLSQPHLESLDRRLRTVLAAVDVCFDEHGENNVLVDKS